MKLQEFGFIDYLEDRWLHPQLDKQVNTGFTNIDLHQVNLIFMILLTGIVVSLIVLTIEKVVYCFYENNRRGKQRNLKKKHLNKRKM